ncbi:MAG: SLBB domain-containing protein [Armatimonadota bacterium]|nr:SLBB domain-containing protein [Armatimonadota bacterium]
MTILEALNGTGAPESGSAYPPELDISADLSRATVTRKGAKPIVVDLDQLINHGGASKNLIIQAGDVIYVPVKISVYILGAVARPGEYYLRFKNSYSVTDLLQLAGGPTADAVVSQTCIAHHLGAGPVTWIPVHLDKNLRKGETQFNIELEPQDVLWVPKRPDERPSQPPPYLFDGLILLKRL